MARSILIFSDPQRLNRYAYSLNNPYRYFDPDGRDISVVVGNPQGNNIFGHVGAGVTNRGIFSSGTPEGLGSSFTDYFNNQATYRDSNVIVLSSTKEQDEAFIQGFMKARDEGHSALKNNCADILGSGLKKAGLISNGAITKLPQHINHQMMSKFMKRQTSSTDRIEKGKINWSGTKQKYKKFEPKKRKGK